MDEIADLVMGTGHGNFRSRPNLAGPHAAAALPFLSRDTAPKSACQGLLFFRARPLSAFMHRRNSERKGRTMARWDDEADRLVVGYGGAGAATVIAAADLGADVLVLEEQPEGRHTPSTRSAAAPMTVTDADNAALPRSLCGGVAAGRGVGRLARAGSWRPRLAQLDLCRGISAEHRRGASGVPGSEAMQSFTSVGHGKALFGHSADAVSRRPSVRVQFDDTGQPPDPRRRPAGCRARDTGPGDVRRIGARQGVGRPAAATSTPMT